jgi:hypothetical protein
MRPEGLSKLKTFIHLIGSRTRNLPTVPQCLNHYCVLHISGQHAEFQERNAGALGSMSCLPCAYQSREVNMDVEEVSSHLNHRALFVRQALAHPAPQEAFLGTLRKGHAHFIPY